MAAVSNGLKLSANVTDDVTVLSAAMEGSITSSGEMSYSSSARHFTLTSSRFMWETFKESAASSSRIRSGLYIADVLSVKSSNLRQGNPTDVMELLSISIDAGEDGAATVFLNFANDATLSLSVECINMTLTDVGDPWATDHIPTHETNDDKSSK
ncbi:MAG: DUF2948 family protein [Sneathiella sp.]|nr:DUF2948 family protein [Sneathiella sp.]